MLIRCTALNPSKQKTMEKGRWLEPECYKDPVDATDHAINLEEIALKLDGCDQDIKTTITLPLDEYRLLISDAQKKAKEEGCKEGRDEAWDLARRIVTYGPDCYDFEDIRNLFGVNTPGKVLKKPLKEVLAKDMEIQKEKKTLHVGDEVMIDTTRAYITSLNVGTPGLVRALSKDGNSFTVLAECAKKTGKHNSDMEKVMASFEEDKE